MKDKAKLVLVLDTARPGRARDVLLDVAKSLLQVAREQGLKEGAYQVYVEEAKS